jgi:S-formylglutathione hydrolase FrmB
MNRTQLFLFASLLFTVVPLARSEATADVLEFTSTNLVGNPLHDPAQRRALICLPSNVASNAAAPIVYFLPGFGNSAEKFLKNKATWLRFVEKVSTEIGPMRLVIIDGHNRWGGSQYVNSSAQGHYADYICDELIGRVEARYRIPKTGVRRIIAGHSSGGYGALRLGSYRREMFDGVIALSPDSYFQVTHLPLVQVPSCRDASLSEIRGLMHDADRKPMPKDGDLVYAIALCAAYAPVANHPGEFEWLYDEQHKFRDDVWQRWIDADPLTIAQKNKNAFLPTQAIYLEGAAQDQYKANIGAKKIYEALQGQPCRTTFREPPGRHSDHAMDRLQAGIEWVLGRGGKRLLE